MTSVNISINNCFKGNMAVNSSPVHVLPFIYPYFTSICCKGCIRIYVFHLVKGGTNCTNIAHVILFFMKFNITLQFTGNTLSIQT